MVEMKHKPRERVDICSISGCKNPVVKSVSSRKAKSALSGVSSSGKRTYLCKQHYKEFKKATKKEREDETMGWR
jgi:hypothetical protein